MMNQNELEKFKTILLDQRQELLEELIMSDQNLSHMEAFQGGDLVDQASNFYEKEFLIGLSSSEKEMLESIERALGKIKKNQYGTCELCQNPIDSKRLEAIPYAKLCMNCKKSQLKHRKTPVF